MGISTKLNLKVKNYVLAFWNLVPADNKDKLYFYLIDGINSIIDNDGKITGIYKFFICVNHRVYKKIERKKEAFLYYLERKIEEYLMYAGFKTKYSNILIEFLPLSYLKDFEVKILHNCLKKQQSNRFCFRLINNKGTRWIIDCPGEYKIGRRDDAFIKINNPYVSELHAKLELTESGNLKISDCGSRNGTYLNDNLKPAKNDEYIVPGDKIYLGKSKRIAIELINK